MKSLVQIWKKLSIITVLTIVLVSFGANILIANAAMVNVNVADGGSSRSGSGTNKTLSVNASSRKIEKGTTCTFTASSTGTSGNYSWSRVSGSSASIFSGSTHAMVTIKGNSAGVSTFRVTKDGLSKTVTVTVTDKTISGSGTQQTPSGGNTPQTPSGGSNSQTPSGSGTPPTQVVPTLSTTTVTIPLGGSRTVNIRNPRSSETYMWSISKRSGQNGRISVSSKYGTSTNIIGLEEGELSITVFRDSLVMGSISVKVTAENAEPVDEILSIEFPVTQITMKKNSSTQIRRNTYPRTAKDKDLVWSSSDNSIATVSSTGNVSSKNKDGIVTITAKTKSGSSVAKCVVIVGSSKITASLSQSSIPELQVGNSQTINIDVTNGVEVINVYSSNSNVVEVSWGSGKKSFGVVAKKSGKATIYVELSNGSRLSCLITVPGQEDGQVPENPEGASGSATIYLALNKDRTLSASGATYWESSNSTIVSCTSSGKIKGKKATDTPIKVTGYSNKKDKTPIITYYVYVVGDLKINKSLTVHEGDTISVFDVVSGLREKPYAAAMARQYSFRVEGKYTNQLSSSGTSIKVIVGSVKASGNDYCVNAKCKLNNGSSDTEINVKILEPAILKDTTVVINGNESVDLLGRLNVPEAYTKNVSFKKADGKDKIITLSGSVVKGLQNGISKVIATRKITSSKSETAQITVNVQNYQDPVVKKGTLYGYLGGKSISIPDNGEKSFEIGNKKIVSGISKHTATLKSTGETKVTGKDELDRVVSEYTIVCYSASVNSGFEKHQGDSISGAEILPILQDGELPSSEKSKFAFSTTHTRQLSINGQNVKILDNAYIADSNKKYVVAEVKVTYGGSTVGTVKIKIYRKEEPISTEPQSWKIGSLPSMVYVDEGIVASDYPETWNWVEELDVSEYISPTPREADVFSDISVKITKGSDCVSLSGTTLIAKKQGSASIEITNTKYKKLAKLKANITVHGLYNQSGIKFNSTVYGKVKDTININGGVITEGYTSDWLFEKTSDKQFAYRTNGSKSIYLNGETEGTYAWIKNKVTGETHQITVVIAKDEKIKFSSDTFTMDVLSDEYNYYKLSYTSTCGKDVVYVWSNSAGQNDYEIGSDGTVSAAGDNTETITITVEAYRGNKLVAKASCKLKAVSYEDKPVVFLGNGYEFEVGSSLNISDVVSGKEAEDWIFSSVRNKDYIRINSPSQITFIKKTNKAQSQFTIKNTKTKKTHTISVWIVE
ncbi:MAG: Ig-like domain-containing protein [Clostridia bacterium]|nr:Ig-like domain-containing protein [Clostridia bacterium]